MHKIWDGDWISCIHGDAWMDGIIEESMEFNFELNVVFDEYFIHPCSWGYAHWHEWVEY